jgi:hypothetical protein
MGKVALGCGCVIVNCYQTHYRNFDQSLALDHAF